MIGYIKGILLKKYDDKILLLVNQIGYEILLPEIVMKTLSAKSSNDEISLYIYHQQTERQPKPILIGFNLEIEKEFFQYFISVEDIGPFKAVKAMNIPVRDIARAIESKDVNKLKQLKGIGVRTAHKIIATLEGKMDKIALLRETSQRQAPVCDLSTQVFDVLVNQLGHSALDAKKMIAKAMSRGASISTAEDLFEEIYRNEKTT